MVYALAGGSYELSQNLLCVVVSNAVPIFLNLLRIAWKMSFTPFHLNISVTIFCKISKLMHWIMFNIRSS